MELKVGMYIRTRDENISKIKYINKFIYTDKQRYGKHYIEKASENIIDLIEVGDYVNGKRVDEIALIEDVWFVKTKVSNIDNYDYLPERLIEDIVTKEQFNSMKYVVERDK